jgi:hypothetical protein
VKMSKCFQGREQSAAAVLQDKRQANWAVSRYGHTIKFTPHPIPNCEVKLDGPVQYWGGGPPGKFVVLYLPSLFTLFFALASPLPSTLSKSRLGSATKRFQKKSCALFTELSP